jgi:hypothetical protein
VRYRLIDRHTGKASWTEDLMAADSFGPNAAIFFAPGNTQYNALICACGKNIRLRIDKLAALPPVELENRPMAP